MNARLTLIALIWPLLFASDAISWQQDLVEEGSAFSVDDPVRLTIDVTSEDLQRLQRDGRLQMRVHDFFEGRIAAILLRFNDPLMDKKVRVAGELEVNEKTCRVPVSQLMVERLLIQPIEFRVFVKDFSQVEILLVNEEPQDSYHQIEAGITREEYDIRIGNRILQARISELDALMVTTDFGELKIPWDQVQSLKFGNRGLAKVRVRNGTVVTGQLDLKELDMMTRWGRIKVPTDDLTIISR